MADEHYHARLVIHDLPTMTLKEKRELVQWLLDKAYEIRDCRPSDYNKRYTARLMK